jgi:YaaC-like Protein
MPPQTLVDVHRYPNLQGVGTCTEPLQSVLSWVAGLRSVGYVEDLLRTTHRLPGQMAHEAARSIAAHSRMSVNLFEEGLQSRVDTGYLPLYYGMLDLAKVVVIAGGRLEQLRNQRQHGISWSGIDTRCHDLATDHVTVMGEGAFPLFYQTLVGSMWPNTRQRARNNTWISTPKRQLLLRNIYPYVAVVAYEYGQIYQVTKKLAPVITRVVKTSATQGHVQLSFIGRPNPGTTNPRHFKALRNLRPDGDHYVGPTVTGQTDAEIVTAATGDFRRFLLYDGVQRGPFPLGIQAGPVQVAPIATIMASMTPVSNAGFLLPEEIPILLAFFHLGSVTRYDPERLERLLDSPSCSLISAMLREACFRYILRCWSFIQQTEYIFNT